LKAKEFEISDYNYIASSIGNAYFSGVSFEQLWNCVSISNNREELDATVSATILFNDLIRRNK
jgi:hypothetical protein